MSIRWYVVQWSSDVNVQRGIQNQSGTVIDIPITAVAAVNQAFVTWSKFPQLGDTNNLDNDDPIIGELTTTTNLQFRVDMPRPAVDIYWQVIEFTNAADINVQKNTLTELIGNNLSVDVTLPIAVDPPPRSCLSGTTRPAGPPGHRRPYDARPAARRHDGPHRDRSIGGADLTEISVQPSTAGRLRCCAAAQASPTGWPRTSLVSAGASSA
jgi:hypothetical protein